MPLHRHETDDRLHEEVALNPLHSAAGGPELVPRLRIPQGSMAPDVAARLVRDQLILDGNARLNLATFVTTWMEPEGAALMADTFDKNMVDKDEYPQTAELELRCVNMLADLWHAPAGEQATGTSTTGSSEAAMLGGLAGARLHPPGQPPGRRRAASRRAQRLQRRHGRHPPLPP